MSTGVEMGMSRIINEGKRLALGFVLAMIAAGAVFAETGAPDADEQAASCHTTGNWPAQIAACTSAIKSGLWTGEGLAWAFQSRAVGYENTGDLAHALEDEEEAIKLKPKNSRAYEEHGYIYGLMGDYARAIPDLDRAVALDPANWTALQKRCLMRTEWGRELDSALEDCNKAMELAPAAFSLSCSRGFVYLRMEKFADAIDDCNKALSNGPPLAFHLYVRGLAKRKSGDTTGGDADIASAKALDLNIADRFAKYGLGT
jgi:tetratricopeptide (TPR) repeat protein